MNQELLCTWLGLPKAAWPPDPWTLLGLAAGDHELTVIEQRVQERMTKLRTYQLSFPEEATEGMNRLAEAFIALAEKCSKAAPIPAAVPQPAPILLPSSKDDTSIIKQTKVDWQIEPPPVRGEKTESVPELIVEEAAGNDVLVAKPFAAPAKPYRREADPALVHELAEESAEANSNVGTLDAVIERVETTRRLLYAWEKVGKYMKTAAKKPSAKLGEQFAKRFDEIAEVMKSYPAFLGQPGKPGYRVVVMARLKIPLTNVRTMTQEQRDELLFDWDVAHQVLLMHRKYLHRLFKSMRHRSALGRVVHAVRSFLNDYPRLTLIGMVLFVVLALIGGVFIALRRP